MRKFGLEVEFVGSRSRINQEARRVGLAVGDSGSHTGHSETQWLTKHDGSVSGGAELVSPPLDFDSASDRNKVDTAIAALQLGGASTHNSAGIHVHIDASDLSAQQVANVGRFMFKFEDVIYRIASSGWTRLRPAGMNNYCKPVPEEMVRRLCKVRDLDGFYRAWYGSVQDGLHFRNSHYHESRYHGLNLHSWCYRGTIEFRIFNSSLNPDRVQAYIALSMAIVQDAREGFRRSTGKAYRLGGMADGTTNPDSAMMRLQQVLRSESKDTKVLMSKEDWKRVRYCWRDSVGQRPGAVTY